MYAMTDIRLLHICLEKLTKGCCFTGSIMRYQKEKRQKKREWIKNTRDDVWLPQFLILKLNNSAVTISR
jgi:hypothetical protein